jgi:acyl-CoA synthetase (AMP-forming)/AMP-acid ligase II
MPARVQSLATIGRMIEVNERRVPNEVAFVYGDQRPTFAEFAQRSRRLASALHKMGCRRQDRLALLAENRLETCEVYGACEIAGYITATVNYRLAPPEMLHVIADSAAQILVFEEKYASVVDALRPRLEHVRSYICIGEAPEWAQRLDDIAASGDADGPPYRADEDDIAYLIYTSGTTGRAKGCMLGQKAQLRVAQACSADLGITSVDRTLLAMPLVHVGAKVVQLAAHWQGSSAIILNKFEPGPYFEMLEREKATVGHLAPTMIQMLLEHPLAAKADVSSLRVVLYSASPMPTPVLRRAIKVFGNVFHQQYGLTEGAGTSLHSQRHKPDGDENDQRRLASAGIPFAGVEVRIAAENGEECAPGEPGEICLRGESLMRGYWNNSAATIDTLRDGWMHTGDIGRVDEDGYLYLVDRKKDMIISGGQNIYSREVEEALFAHPAVLEAAVIGVRDEKWGETVRALIVRRAEATLTEEEVIAHCRANLAGYKKPKSVMFIDELPKLASGKVNKQELRALYGESSAAP